MLFNNALKKVGAILFGVGLLMLIINLVTSLWSVILMATTESTIGYVKDVQVLEIHSNSNSRNRSVNHSTTMLIEYTVNDVVYEKAFKVGNASANEGRPITVYYKKNNPSKAVTGKEASPIDGFSIFVIMLFGGLTYLKGTEES